METQAKIADQQARIALEQRKVTDKSAMEKGKVESAERIAEGNAGMDLVKILLESKAKDGEITAEEARLSAEMGMKISELLLSAEKMMRLEKAEGAKIGSKLVEKFMDLEGELIRSRNGGE